MTAVTNRELGGPRPTARTGPGWTSRRRRVALVGAAVGAFYLAVSVAVWWQVWSGHPTSAMTCGCGDPSLFLSSFSWVAYAIGHGHDPFLSTAMYHPAGINLLANTTALLEAFVLAPVTWLFGPIASLNVANTLAPAVSAMASYWAARRTLRVGRLGALVAGLVVELSPAIIGSSSLSHLQVSLLAFVPVVGVALYELLVVQAGRPWRWGAILATAAVGQFFAGTELFLLLALLASVVVGVAAVGVLVAVVRGSETAPARAAYAARGLGIGAVGAGVLLALPAWFALKGPQHYTGRPWGNLTNLAGSRLDSIVSAPADAGVGLIHLAGYLGPVGAPGNFLGLGAVLGAVAATALLWRRPVVWTLAAVAALTTWLSFGAVWAPGATPAPRPAWVPFLPWATLGRLPVLRNVLAENFSALTIVAVALLCGLLVDRIARLGSGPLRTVSGAGALAVAVGVLVPLASTWPLPLTANVVHPPAWFVHEAPHLPAGSVVLAYPMAGPLGDGEAVVWQAAVGMRSPLAGGFGLVPGPDGHVEHGAVTGSAAAILGGLTGGVYRPLPALDDVAAMDTVRTAIHDWGVTTVVVTDRGHEPAYAVQWYTRLFGRPPQLQDGSRIWTLS